MRSGRYVKRSTGVNVACLARLATDRAPLTPSATGLLSDTELTRRARIAGGAAPRPPSEINVSETAVLDRNLPNSDFFHESGSASVVTA
jgi:hypothetical protein